MGLTYSVYIDISYVPWHIFDWLEKDMGALYLADFNWHWEEGTGRMRIDFFNEELASMTVLKWS